MRYLIWMLLFLFMGLFGILQQLSAEDLNKSKDKVQKAVIQARSSNDIGSQPREILIESVIASVDGVPITLREFSERLVPKRKITVADFASDPALLQSLDAMIMERLIEAEATSRKIKATPEDVEKYIDQVASQNNLTRQQFELALAQQGKNMQEYSTQARLEILRSRLMGQIAQSAPAVTDDELSESDKDSDQESEESEENKSVRFKIREIVLLIPQGQTQVDPALVQKVEAKLASGQDFSSVARELSDGSTAQLGGDLGELAEEDLSDSIKQAVSDLSPGEYSKPLEMSDSIRIFLLEERYDEGEASNAGNLHREQLRKQLESRKLESKFQEFFTVELPKLHKVEKKV